MAENPSSSQSDSQKHNAYRTCCSSAQSYSAPTSKGSNPQKSGRGTEDPPSTPATYDAPTC